MNRIRGREKKGSYGRKEVGRELQRDVGRWNFVRSWWRKYKRTCRREETRCSVDELAVSKRERKGGIVRKNEICWYCDNEI